MVYLLLLRLYSMKSFLNQIVSILRIRSERSPNHDLCSSLAGCKDWVCFSQSTIPRFLKSGVHQIRLTNRSLVVQLILPFGDKLPWWRSFVSFSWGPLPLSWGTGPSRGPMTIPSPSSFSWSAFSFLIFLSKPSIKRKKRFSKVSFSFDNKIFSLLIKLYIVFFHQILSYISSIHPFQEQNYPAYRAILLTNHKCILEKFLFFLSDNCKKNGNWQGSNAVYRIRKFSQKNKSLQPGNNVYNSKITKNKRNSLNEPPPSPSFLLRWMKIL